MPRLLSTTVALLLGLSALTALAAESPPPPLPSREERLVHLARLWGQVRYHHPALLYKDIDWDAALVAALPRVEAAKDRAAYAAAMQGLLDVLKDPATRVQRPEEPSTTGAPGVPVRELRHWEGRDVLVADLRALEVPKVQTALSAQVATLRPEVVRAKAVILDLRGRGLDDSRRWTLHLALGEVLPLLLSQPLEVPGERSVFCSGYQAQVSPGGPYSTSLLTTAGEVLTPKGDGKARTLVVLLDDKSYVDASLLALKAQGLAQLVTEGPLDDGASVEQSRVELGAGLTALVRMSELGLPVRADVVLPARVRAEGKDESLQKALELARKPARAVRTREPTLPVGRWRADRAYETQLYPSREYRLLALFRLWNVIELFYPYKHLLDRDWSGALSTFLPRFEGAKDAAEYALAVAEMSTLIQDGHTTLRGHPELEKRGISGVYAPFEVMEIEGKAVVTRVWDAQAAPGIAPGQVVETYEGKPLAERLEALKPYVTASNAQGLRHRLLARALSGPEGSQATVEVSDASGPRKAVRFTRSIKSLQKPLTGDSSRLLPDNVGYVDLTRLQPSEVPALFEKMKGTRALVLDMRGYPNGTAWPIAPYLNTHKARYGAVFERNLVATEGQEGRHKSFQELPRANVPLYRGRTVMLIDERTISQAEHTGLFFEAANGTTFIGSPSAGANGDITNLVLPGGITLVFTGHDVRHMDGRQLQRVGLTPQVYVRPTLAGLQAGRDEVLNKALDVLRDAPLPVAGEGTR